MEVEAIKDSLDLLDNRLNQLYQFIESNGSISNYKTPGENQIEVLKKAFYEVKKAFLKLLTYCKPSYFQPILDNLNPYEQTESSMSYYTKQSKDKYNFFKECCADSAGASNMEEASLIH